MARARRFDPRTLAARVVQGVMGGQSLADLIPRQAALLKDSRDAGLMQELSYGVMRGYPRLLGLSKRLLSKPLKARDRDVQALILVGLYQLSELRVADHAAVHATADAARHLGKSWAVGLVNGVLRNFQRNQAQLLEQVAADPEARYAMPGWLLQAIRGQWPDRWEAVVEALNARPPMSLRVNLGRHARDEYLGLLQAEGLHAAPIPHTRSGVVLESPCDVSRLPGFEAGWVSVQDGAAQLAAELLDLQPGQRVLDACAAPGGKTGHLLEREPGIQLTALDRDAERLRRVDENLQRLALQAEVVVGDAAHPEGTWADRSYPRILLDVPCSATGVMRRHPDIKLLRRAADIPALVALQAQILRAVWSRLEDGGTLIYATCSILAEENEQQLRAFLAEHPDAREIPLAVDWGEPREIGRQIVPGSDGMDGFYYACLLKEC
ncbi:MAG: 16S rRNA (cytosine(967)-C(5))-methyltransferase RsmB [Candidatus Thiodiazotropha sp.]